MSETTLTPDDIGEGAKALLLRETATANVAALTDELNHQSRAAAKVIETVLAG